LSSVGLITFTGHVPHICDTIQTGHLHNSPYNNPHHPVKEPGANVAMLGTAASAPADMVLNLDDKG